MIRVCFGDVVRGAGDRARKCGDLGVTTSVSLTVFGHDGLRWSASAVRDPLCVEYNTAW